MFALQDRARVDEMLYYDATVTNKTWQELMVSEKVFSRRRKIHAAQSTEINGSSVRPFFSHMQIDT